MVEGVLLYPRSFLRLGESGLEPQDTVFGLESIGGFSWSSEFRLEEEGVLCAVYRGEDELSESLCSIPYFAMVADARNSQSLKGESILL